MTKQTRLWTVSLSVNQSHAAPIEAFFSERALTTSVFAPPRVKSAKIDASFDKKPNIAKLTAELSIIAMLNGFTAPKLTLKEIADLNWLKKVAADFPPIKLARWTIHGAAHRTAVKNRKNALQIDAEAAFGTGEHPTTKGCLKLLDKLIKTEPELYQMLDVGCGSGILAMAFAQATGGAAVAVDLDPEAVKIAKKNAAINNLTPLLRLAKSNGYAAALVQKKAPYDLIMANIFADPLIALSKDLSTHLRMGGYAILAGLLNTQASKVLTAHRQQGLSLRERLVLGEWTIFLLQKGKRNGICAHRPTSNRASKKIKGSASGRVSRSTK